MIKLGNNDITLKVGSTDVSAAYLGSTLVYSGGTPPTPSFNGKWLATYSDSHTESAECDASSAITEGEITLTNLAAVEIGDCVIDIDNAFDGCSGLTNVTIGSGVTYIGQYTFRNCRGLTSITIPDSVTAIDDNAFNYCTRLTSIDIPSGVTSIGAFAFQGCTSLTSVTIGSSVDYIGNYAFRGCSGLTSITINATTPPTLGNAKVFASTNDCPIYVPAASVSAYQSAAYWSSLSSRIQAIGGGENPNSGGNGNPNIGGIDDEDLPPDN